MIHAILVPIRASGVAYNIDKAINHPRNNATRSRKVLLRSTTPDLLRHKFWGLLLAHSAVRGLMQEEVLDEILEERVAGSRGKQVPRGVKRRMSSYPLRPHTPQPTTRIDFIATIRIIK